MIIHSLNKPAPDPPTRSRAVLRAAIPGALVFLFLATISAAPLPRPTFSQLAGDVAVRPGTGEAWAAASLGMELDPGDTVRTGYRSKAEISAPSGVIRLYENTILVVPENTGSEGGLRQFILKLGAGIFDSGGSPDSQLSIVTSQVIVGIRTARATVIAGEGASTVASHAGKVAVTDLMSASAPAREISQGFMLSVTSPETTRGRPGRTLFGRTLPFEETGAWDSWEKVDSPDIPAVPASPGGFPF
jgi:hypothetical protein